MNNKINSNNFLLAAIAAILSAMLTVIGFFICVIIFVGLPVGGLDTIWTIATAFIVGFISLILGSLMGLIVSGLKLNTIPTLLIGLIIGLVHGTILMFCLAQSINVSIRFLFLTSLAAVGIVSYIIVELVIIKLRKRFLPELFS